MEKNVIYNEDCMDSMDRFYEKSIDGIITSPPYNMNVKRSDCYYNNGYSEIDALPEDEYLNKRISEFTKFSKILKDDGVICYNISYSKENPIMPTILAAMVHNLTDFTLADIICWKKNTAIPFQTSPTKLSRICELVYIFVKKKNLHSFKTNKKVSKVNPKTGQKFYKNYTNLIEARNNDGFKSNHKATYSQDFANKLINIYFAEGSLIYDPFTGIGTTQLSCIANNCDYIGSEIIEEFYKITKQRIYQKTKTEV